jgi:multiple sugar transport system ATP-binding protein
MAQIRLENLSKYYGKVKAVDEINLDIQDNEFVVFLGPSGCGKTTTLRCVAGLETVTGGNIYFGDRNVNDFEPADRNIAMVFQHYALYPHLKVRRNISFPLKAEKMPPSERNKKVKEVAELLGIENLLNRRISELPDGDKQKVALARAIVRTPEVLLLDEPLSALDEVFREQMRIEFLKIQKALQVTTVYVTHDQREAMILADKIVVMNDGKIVETGAPKKLYEEPQNLFTGYFIGSPGMNFFDCTKKGDGTVTLGDGEDISFSEAYRQKALSLSKADFVFGIRPEYLFFKEKLDGESNYFKIKLVNVERIHEINYGNFYLGENLYKCFVSNGEELGGREGFAVFEDPKILFYDPASGKIL